MTRNTQVTNRATANKNNGRAIVNTKKNNATHVYFFFSFFVVRMKADSPRLTRFRGGPGTRRLFVDVRVTGREEEDDDEEEAGAAADFTVSRAGARRGGARDIFDDSSSCFFESSPAASLFSDSALSCFLRMNPA